MIYKQVSYLLEQSSELIRGRTRKLELLKKAVCNKNLSDMQRRKEYLMTINNNMFNIDRDQEMIWN